MVSHQLQEEFLKFKFLSKSMKTVSWTLLLLIKEPQRMLKLQSPITKVDCPNKKSKSLLKKLKDSKIKIKKSEKELKLKTLLKAIVLVLDIL